MSEKYGIKNQIDNLNYKKYNNVHLFVFILLYLLIISSLRL